MIDLRGVRKIYNTGETEVRALDGIDLSIERGEFVAVVGQSGSGKSTFMNTLGCLDTPSSGEYYLDGENIADKDDDCLSKIRNHQIGFIFQNFNLVPSLSAVENVELPLMYRGVSKDNRRHLATQALGKVGLLSRLHHRPSQLSGGQQQRVAIARAIAARPPIILADEPTGNLDSRSGLEVVEILKELWMEGRTVIIITHDMNLANQTKRIVCIFDGKVTEDRRIS